MGARFLENTFLVPRRYTAFSNNKKIVEKVEAHEVGGHAAKDQKQYEFPA